MQIKEKAPLVTVLDRLEAGNLSIPEVCALENCGKTGFYEDLNAGLVTIRRLGARPTSPWPYRQTLHRWRAAPHS